MHSVGLKQAEIDALIDFQPNKLMLEMSLVEKKVIYDWLFQTFGDNPDFDKKGLFALNRRPDRGRVFSPFQELRNNSGRSTSKHLISSVVAFIVEEVKKYDPNFEFRGLKSFGSTTFTVTFPFLVLSYEPTKEQFQRLTPVQKYCVKKLRLARRYVRYIQYLALAEQIPLTLTLSIVRDADPEVLHRFREEGLESGNLNLTFNCQIPNYLIRSPIEAQEPPERFLHELVTNVSFPSRYDPSGESMTDGLNLQLNQRTCLTKDMKTIIKNQDWSLERIRPVTPYIVIFYVEKLKQVLKTFSRLKDLTEAEL